MQNIFVVDDDPVQREALAALVRQDGWQAQSFGSAGECLSALSRTLPDCILADLYMPDMDGADFLEVLMARGIEVPVVVITGGAADTPVARRALDAGARTVLRKSCKPEELRYAIERAALAGRRKRAR